MGGKAGKGRKRPPMTLHREGKAYYTAMDGQNPPKPPMTFLSSPCLRVGGGQKMRFFARRSIFPLVAGFFGSDWIFHVLQSIGRTMSWIAYPGHF